LDTLAASFQVRTVADNMLGDPACFDIREAQRPADISDF